MTTTLERPARKGDKKAKAGAPGKDALHLSRPPQVNLLPPEVHAARVLGRVKRWLVVVVVLALVAAAGLVALGALAQNAAQDELVVQQQTTEALLVEQAKYAEVPIVLSQLTSITTAREVGMSTEVLWRDYLRAVAAVAPADVSIESLSVVVAPPNEAVPPPFSDLHGPTVGTITFTAHSATVPDTAGWIDALESIPGLADAWFSAAAFNEQEGVAYYTVSGTVQIEETARAGRFGAEEDES